MATVCVDAGKIEIIIETYAIVIIVFVSTYHCNYLGKRSWLCYLNLSFGCRPLVKILFGFGFEINFALHNGSACARAMIIGGSIHVQYMTINFLAAIESSVCEWRRDR